MTFHGIELVHKLLITLRCVVDDGAGGKEGRWSCWTETFLLAIVTARLKGSCLPLLFRGRGLSKEASSEGGEGGSGLVLQDEWLCVQPGPPPPILSVQAT